MAANIPRVPTQENVSSTLSSGITDVATTITIGDTSKLVFPCYLVIDRVDSAGTLKSTSLWEYVKVTNIAGNDLTVTRAQGGSTAQAHSSGAVIEAVVTAAHFADWYAVLNPEHDTTGGHVIGTATINYAETKQLVTASLASLAATSIGVDRVVTHLNASGASISGMAFGFGFYAPGFVSAATTNVMRMIAHRSGTFRFFTAMTRTPVSTASLTLTLFKNGASVFNALGRPAIMGGGTFVSTASILTPNFLPGDIFQLDIDTGGNVADILLEGIAY